MTKKKITHIIQSLSNGGCENMLLRTIPLLHDFEHTIITLKEPGELAPQFVSAGITIKTVSCAGIFDIPGILRLRKLVRGERPDIVITYLFHADMLGRIFLRIKNTPVIPSLRTTYNHPKYLIARILEWITKPLVNQYLANSVAVKDFYIKHIGVHPEKITVIPNGINIGYFDSIIPNPDLRKSLNIAPSDFVIICVANLHINKGHCYLLEAFEGCNLKNAKLLIVGDGNEKESLLHQIENYQSKENIIFLGRRTDVPQLLKISNLFILPTLFEGQSNAIMEAMATGLPIITTDIPENQSLIENNVSGMLVPTHETKALSQAINTIMIDEGFSDRLGKDGKEFLEQNFSLKASVNSFHQFLNSL
jgi:glycosyltransferase involved in cell wall biosynthesis